MDFSNLSSNDIILNRETKEITITLNPPEVFSINIDEDKTIYNEPDLGILRFGDIQIPAEKLGEIRTKLSESFKNKMNDDKLRKQATDNTSILLEDLINNITNETYKINITTTK